MKYTLKNLDCANCASKIENKIKGLKGVTHVSVNFLTQRLTIEAENLEEIMPEVIKIAKKIDKKIEIK